MNRRGSYDDRPLDQIVTQLKAANEKLDTAASTATRAQADAQQAHTHYDNAGRGSTHPAIKGAKTESTTAAEKAGKVGRLLAEPAPTSPHTSTSSLPAPSQPSTQQRRPCLQVRAAASRDGGLVRVGS
jgi:hypothetical protein